MSEKFSLNARPLISDKGPATVVVVAGRVVGDEPGRLELLVFLHVPTEAKSQAQVQGKGASRGDPLTKDMLFFSPCTYC